MRDMELFADSALIKTTVRVVATSTIERGLHQDDADAPTSNITPRVDLRILPASENLA